jgi:succinate dehydrogenase hydrophobic anchor subunit
MFWFWRLLASGMFLMAASHGVHGLVVIADDYIVSSGGRKFVRFLSMIAVAGMTVAGLYVLWTY